jgi:hypothetical protein
MLLENKYSIAFTSYCDTLPCHFSQLYGSPYVIFKRLYVINLVITGNQIITMYHNL